MNQTTDDYPLTTVDDFFRFVNENLRRKRNEQTFSSFSRRNNENRQEFDVCNRDNLRQESLFKLYLPLKTSVKDVIRLIAERIEFSEEQIILQKSSMTTNSNSTTSLPISSDQTLKDLYVNTRSSMSSPRKIFFRRLPFKYTELETRRSIRIFLTNPMKKDEQREVQFYAKKSSTIGEFLDEIRQWLPNLNSNRLIEVSLANQINPLPFHLRICSNRSSIDEIENNSNRFYHFEEISPDEIEIGKDAELIPVAHYTKVIEKMKMKIKSNEKNHRAFL